MLVMEKSVVHYKEFLEREFQSRLRRNPAYSLRAFARDLEMSPSKVSEVLRGLRGLSKKTAEKIANKINLTPQESSIFTHLIDFHQTRSSFAKQRATEKLKELAAIDGYAEMNLERFKIISDWYHFAILELIETENFESDVSWIAGRLGISIQIATTAVSRLMESGLLVRNAAGKFSQTHIQLATPSGIPSREIREHHSQILMKADAALSNVDVQERDFSAITLAFDSKQMDEVRAELKKMRRRLGQKIQDRTIKNRVYCLAMQFFPLDTKPEINSKNIKGRKK